jgi:hypothetical protein
MESGASPAGQMARRGAATRQHREGRSIDAMGQSVSRRARRRSGRSAWRGSSASWPAIARARLSWCGARQPWRIAASSRARTWRVGARFQNREGLTSVTPRRCCACERVKRREEERRWQRVIVGCLSKKMAQFGCSSAKAPSCVGGSFPTRLLAANYRLYDQLIASDHKDTPRIVAER